jgi:hypothetical protein
MKPRLTLVVLGLAFCVLVALGLKAQEPAQPQRDDIVTSEQQLKAQFAKFTESLLKLQQKLARGTPEERRRAEKFAKVLKECNELAIDQEFTKLINQMREANITNLGQLNKLKLQSESLGAKLQQILQMLQESDLIDLNQRTNDIRAALDALNKAIDAQKIAEALTDPNRKIDPKQLQKIQDAVTKDTKKVADKINDILNDGKKGQGGEATPSKGEDKGEGKNEGKGGEAKNDGKPTPAEAKGSPKDAGGDSKGSKGETKPGADKGGQPSKAGGEPKSGAKPGDGKGDGAPKAGAKSDKGGDKGGQGSAKKNDGDKKGNEGGAKDSGKKDGGDPKKDGPQGSAKGDDSKGGDPKGGGSPKDGGAPSDSKAKPGGGDGKGGGGPPPQVAENKNNRGDGKGGEGKGGDVKGGDGKQGESKSGGSASGQSSAKEGGAAPSPGNPPSPPPGGAAKDGGSPPPPGGGDKKNNKETDDIAQSGKKVQEAGYDQNQASDKIKEGKPKDAQKNQADAIAKMEEAKKKLENLLRQMREEEIERVLAALQARCEKMLVMQKQVLAGTIDTEVAVNKNSDKKPNRENKVAAQALADKEKEIVQEANKCIDILQAEGSAVAFPEVFQQLRTDMMHVQKRLDVADVFQTTQDIEQDIIDNLEEMIKALKKARDDNQSDPGKGDGKPGKSGKPADPKLLELVQELKMVRSLQKRLNDRTELYGKRYPGEQAADPTIVRELRSLADRQMRIQEIVRRIANGDNK